MNYVMVPVPAEHAEEVRHVVVGIAMREAQRQAAEAAEAGEAGPTSESQEVDLGGDQLPAIGEVESGPEER